MTDRIMRVHIAREQREWQRDAACRGMPVEIFFPEDGSTLQATQALAICAQCPVVQDCRAYADSTETVSTTCGVLGAETPNVRIARRRRERAGPLPVVEVYDSVFRAERRADG